MQTVKVLRPFNRTPQGGLVDVGETIDVEPTRAQELARLGLAEPVGGVKAAPAPENKQAPTPENKVAPAAITSDRMRRTGPTTAPAEGVAAAAQTERAAAETVAAENPRPRGRPAGSTRAPRKAAR